MSFSPVFPAWAGVILTAAVLHHVDFGVPRMGGGDPVSAHIGNYNTSDKNEIEEIENNINALAKNPKANDYLLPSGSTRLSIKEATTGLSAMVTFIGLYLGVIFLISSAAVLGLKELSESSDNKQRFRMLRKIGTDEKMINKALFRQIAIFFMLPLILALIHSVFGIICHCT